MKKLICTFTTFIIMWSFLGCPLKPKNEENIVKTTLNIKNQSSVNIKNIKYDGKEATFPNNSGKENILVAGDNCNITLSEETEGYIFFTVFNEEKNINVPVRTSETVVVEKGKSITFVLTDNILVVPVGKMNAVKLLNLVNPAVLKVCNGTSFDITEISYGGKTHKETIVSGGDMGNLI